MPRASTSAQQLRVVRPRVDPAIARLVDEYLAACRAGGLKAKTAEEGYGSPRRGLFLPFRARERTPPPPKLTPAVLDRFTTQLHEVGGVRGPLSKHSIHSYVRAVNGFRKWLATQGTAPRVKAT